AEPLSSRNAPLLHPPVLARFSVARCGRLCLGISNVGALYRTAPAPVQALLSRHPPACVPVLLPRAAVPYSRKPSGPPRASVAPHPRQPLLWPHLPGSPLRADFRNSPAPADRVAGSRAPPRPSRDFQARQGAA